MPTRTYPPLFTQDWLVRYDYVEEHLGVLKAGKESQVHLVLRSDRARTCYIAEKRFTPRRERAFRHDAPYLGSWIEGSRRESRAARKRTAFGRRYLEARWIGNEWSNLQRFAAAGASVPPPVEPIENGYRMAFIGDGAVAAPRLASVRLEPNEAGRLYTQLLDEVRILLACERVHGDLSQYNVLYWRGRAVLIDFSQTVDVITHPGARDLLRRDLERLCAYFRRLGVPADVDEAVATVGGRREIFGR